MTQWPYPDGLSWPPPDHMRSYLGYAEHSAWYAGDPTQLALAYGGTAALGRYANFFGGGGPGILLNPGTGSGAGGILGAVRNMFWGKQGPAPLTRQRVHIPLAADIASTSSDLLFARQPKLYVSAAHQADATPESIATQDRLDEIAEECGLYTILLEGAEIAAAFGGVFLRVGWDKAFSDGPVISLVNPDGAIPEFIWGRLSAVTFWRVISDDGQKTYRHLERHEIGSIQHALYIGTPTQLGDRTSLQDSPDLSIFAQYTAYQISATNPETNADQQMEYDDNIAIIPTNLDRLTAVYVPNMRPGRRERALPLGRSDFEGSEGLMDALDETYTSWMRDLRLGRGRVIVPSEYLKTHGKGQGAHFDLDQEIFTAIEGMNPADGTGMMANQFAIRTDEHRKTADALVERIISTSGYSAATFGIDTGASTQMRTATEVSAREARSHITKNKKAQFWARPLREILYTALMVDNILFGGPAPMPIRVEFQDAMEEDLASTASSLALLQTAGAVSNYMKVKMLHPGMDEGQIQAEVERIEDDQEALVPTLSDVAPAVASNTPPDNSNDSTSPGGSDT